MERPQRRTQVVLLAAFFGALLVGAPLHAERIPRPQPRKAVRAASFAALEDPNPWPASSYQPVEHFVPAPPVAEPLPILEEPAEVQPASYSHRPGIMSRRQWPSEQGPCQCPQCVEGPEAVETPESDGARATDEPQPESSENLPEPPAANLADEQFAGLGNQSMAINDAPYVVGDAFAGGAGIFLDTLSSIDQVGVLPNGAGTRRVKIADNNSPMPRDRLFFAYNDFNNAIPLFGPGGTSLMGADRYTPGFEKTFWGGLASFELITPVANAQNSRIELYSTQGTARQTEFGNLSMALKFLAWRRENLAISGGLGLNLPTAPEAIVSANGQRLFTVKNQATHLLPYGAALWTPTERTYVQGFLQVDVAANGDAVLVADGSASGPLNEQTLLYADLSMGYWLLNNPNNRYVTGIIPTLEFHYTTALNNADYVTVQTGSSVFPYILGNQLNRFDVMNVTAGTHIRLGGLSYLTVAGVFPLGERPEQRQFDSEVVVLFNRLF